MFKERWIAPIAATSVVTFGISEVCALSSTTYRQALSHIPMDKAFGGDIDISSGSDAYGTFLRMAILIRAFAPEKHGPAGDYVFTILDDVAGEETLRSVVYDAAARIALWRTRSNNSIRWWISHRWTSHLPHRRGSSTCR